MLYPDGYSKKSGALFFGVDAKYMTEVRRQIFQLVKYGRFDVQCFKKMSIMERNLYFKFLIEDLDNNQPNQ